mgnify:CR=1 FL=1
MPKYEFEYRLFYENNERAGNLSQENYNAYLEMIDFMREQGESIISIDIYMAEALNEFEAAAAKGQKVKNLIGKDRKAYLNTLKQKVDYAGQLALRKMKESEGFQFSGVIMYLFAAVVCYFFREVFTGSYLLGFLVDLSIALFSAFFVAVGIYQRRKIIKRWNFTTNTFIIDSFMLVISVLVVYMMRNRSYDISAVFLLGGFISSSLLMKREFNRVAYK